MRIAPDQDWEKVYPLRRVTTLEKTYGALDGMTAEDAEEEGVADILRSIEVTGEPFAPCVRLPERAAFAWRLITPSPSPAVSREGPHSRKRDN